jgi:hypothetical protein
VLTVNIKVIKNANNKLLFNKTTPKIQSNNCRH